jgi:hypothetical protein
LLHLSLLENNLVLKGLRFPAGSSLFVVARKSLG